MNPLVVHFLPSVILGVFRFDDEISSVWMSQQDQQEGEFQKHIQGKLRFLPRHVESIIRRQVAVDGIFRSYTQSRNDLDRAIGLGTKADKRAVAFFSRHQHYFGNAIDGNKLAALDHPEKADNFLEIQFVKKVLAPLLNDAGLHAIQPQRQVGPYFLDFALTKGAAPKLALEIDGFGKFQSRKDLDDFLARQNVIAKDKWTLFRYSYAQIMERPNEIIQDLHAVLQDIPAYQNYLGISLSRHTVFSDSGTPRAAGWGVVDVVNDYYRIQNSFICRVLQQSSASTMIHLRDNFQFDFPFVATAVSELFKFLDAVAHLVDVDFQLPNVTVCTRASMVPPGLELHHRVTVNVHESTTDAIFDEITVRRLAQNLPVPPTAASVVRFRANSDPDLDDEWAAGLDYFTDVIFRYASGITHFQKRVFQRIFSGKDVFGIAATGSGKSLCFWLPALLKPGLTVVIAPLRSLMRDQRLSLLRNGIACAEFINSDVAAPLHRRFLEEAKLGYIRLLYVAPERIRIKSFLDELNSLRDLIPVNFLAIDEAHCISEWGHDFRPSYLKLPSLRESLIREGESPPQLIALTATAGAQVVTDIIRILKLSDDSADVVRDKVADRRSFSYQVVAFENTESKSKDYKKVLTATIPKALGYSSLEQLLLAENCRKEKSLGIVFCIFADPHGVASIRDGISHYLFESKALVEPDTVYEADSTGPPGIHPYRLDAFAQVRVRAFASKPPRMCPECHYYGFTKKGAPIDDFDQQSDDLAADASKTPTENINVQVCSRCKHEFDIGDASVIDPRKWDILATNNQKEFKDGSFDILVATKGFGMGIDKSSVRFVVHTSMAGGIESWYQEIGRAGRDDERAHIVLLVEPPNADCCQALNKSENIRQPPCDYMHGCKYGKAALCDYGKQHAFIKSSYPGRESDALRAVRLLDDILDAVDPATQGWAKVRVPSAQIARVELSLHRLTVLGVVEDYFITYGWQAAHFDVKVHPLALAARDPGGEDQLREHLGAVRRSIRLSVNRADKADKVRPLAQCTGEIAKLKAYPNMPWFFGIVYDILGVLLKDTYGRILVMRYDMLWRLLEVVINRNGVCRRIQILSPFQSKESLPDGYRCGLCDICNPSLEGFPQVCNTPNVTSNSDLDAEFERLLAGGAFELRGMDELVDAFAANYSEAKYRRAWGVLEGDPTNLAALYFAVRLSPSEELPGTLKRVLETANRTLALDSVVALYRNLHRRLRGHQDLVRASLAVLNESGSSCDAPSGWAFLAKEASRKTTGVDDAMSRMAECLDFFLFVDLELDNAVGSFQDRVHKLEDAYNARDQQSRGHP